MAKAEMDTAERNKQLGIAYSRASRDLRDAHRDEFNNLYQRWARELGIDWEPRLSKEDAALNQIQKLLAEFPELASKIQPLQSA
jgi:hypothetical protein